jgi:septal ring-binding cell division protein DamX
VTSSASAGTETEATSTVAPPAAPAPPVPAPVAVRPTTAEAVTSVPASTDARRQRLDRMAAEYANESASTPYTLQIAFLCEPASVQSAIEGGGANVWFVPATLGQRHCFRVFWGRYATRAEAQRNAAQVPATYRAGRIVAVRVSEVVKK